MADLHPCGTTTGYYRHWHAKEPACRGCKTAVAVYQNQRRRAAGMKPRTAPMCGTDSGYSLHMRNRDDPCRLCKDAHAAYRNAWIEAKHRRARRGTIPAVIGDYVETYGPMDLRELVLLIRLRHDIGEASIRRAVARMLNDGRLTRGVDIVTDDGRPAALPRCVTDESVGYPVQLEAGWVA